MKNLASARWASSLVLVSVSITFLFNNCGGFVSAQLGGVNDFVVIGPDGVADDSQYPLNNLQISQQDKLYFNNSGDPSTAPRWQSKTINWYYNSTGQPSEFTEENVLAIVQNGIDNWQSVCGIKWVYKGKTTASTSVTNDGVVTFGWGKASGAAGITWVRWNGKLAFAESDLELSNTQVRDTMTLQGVINHELGHQLGLQHSDVSESIMFANPYHSVSYLLTLRDDDIKGCVDLYGGPSSLNQVSTATPNPEPTPNPTPAGTPRPRPTPMPTPNPRPDPTPLPTATPAPDGTPTPAATPPPHRPHRRRHMPSPTPPPVDPGAA